MPRRFSWADDKPAKVLTPVHPDDQLAKPVPRKMPPLPTGEPQKPKPSRAVVSNVPVEPEPEEPKIMAPVAATRHQNTPPAVDPREDVDENDDRDDAERERDEEDEQERERAAARESDEGNGNSNSDDNDAESTSDEAGANGAGANSNRASNGANGAAPLHPAAQNPGTTGMRRPGMASTPKEDGEPITVAKVNELINAHKSDDQAYVAVTRIKPQLINNVDATGWTMRINLDSLDNADDLTERITRYTGGLLYELRFYGTVPPGRRLKNERAFGYVGIARLKINAPPKLPAAEGVDGAHIPFAAAGGGGTSDAMAMATNKLLADMVKGMQDGKGPNGSGNSTENMKLVKEIVESQTAPLIEGHKTTIDFQRREIEKLQAKMEDVLTRPATDPSMMQWMAKSSSESVVQVSKDMQAERERWQAERMALISAAEKDRSQITDRMQLQIDKLTEKLEEANNKVREATERAATERTTREASFEDRIRHKEEMHQRDIESMRRDKENEVKRLSDQLSDERRATDKQRENHSDVLRQQRENYELNTKTQLDKQEGILRERIEGMTNQIKLIEQRASDQEKRYEEKIRDLEKQRDNAQNQLIAAQTAPKPDALATTMQMMGSVRDVAGMMGLRKEEREAPPENEMVALMKGAKDAGIIDGVKGIVTQVASAVAARPTPQPQQQTQQQQLPPNVVMHTVPVYPQQPYYPQQGYPYPQPQPYPQQQFVPMQPAGPPAMGQPSAPQAVHQASQSQHVQQPVPPQAQQPVQQAQPVPQQPAQQPAPQQEAPPQISDAEINIWKMIIGDFESSYDSGMKPDAMSQKILDQLPRAALRSVVDNGVGQFEILVQAILRHRPENPESSLLTPGGQPWLREVFAITAKALAAPTT